ncbi:MAG: 3-oxoacyl-ACP reductase [Bradyrhizobium sp.]|jgi:3-oxoacyl-[acyl-carrier protein] reductase|nr:3-oxoacyl-ACP reductase [Bradyrhizobium sp.]
MAKRDTKTGGKLDGRVAIVTGGARGIGFAIADLFCREGAAVTIVDQQSKEAKSAAAKLAGKYGVNTFGVGCDVSSEKEVEKAFAQAAESLGPAAILVNNAGINTQSPVVDMSVAQWDEMMRVNLRGVFLCCRQLLPGMIGRRYGRIVNISSQLAHKGAPTMAHYAASKAGVLAFTRSLAHEVARDNITVNAICPGPVDTVPWRLVPLKWRRRKLAELPLGRVGRVEEIAPTALLLASDEGSFYIGASLNPNGGDVMM